MLEVWQSLRLLWELEPGTETPKARLTAKVVSLKIKETKRARQKSKLGTTLSYVTKPIHSRDDIAK
eukprot:4367199-Amphidinium_carterae.1